MTLAAAPGQVSSPPGSEATPVGTPEAPLATEWRRSRGIDDLGAALGEIEERYPQLCQRLEIGRSRADEPIWAVQLGLTQDEGRRAQDLRPGVLVLPAGRLDPVVGARAAFELIEQVVSRAAEWEGASHLSESRLFVVPAPDPDAWSDAKRRVNLDRNFPIRWEPWLVGQGSPGPYPLSEPESRALADFVIARPCVGLTVVLTASEGAAVSLDLSGGQRYPGGSLGAFLVEGLSVSVLDDQSEVFRAARPASGLDGWRLSQLAAAFLPSLVLEVGVVQRLDRELWQVDVVLENPASTGTAIGELGPEGGAVWLELAGAELVTLGVDRVADASEVAFDLVHSRPGGFALVPLAGGERRTLRLWIRGDEAARAVLHARSARAGGVDLELLLE